MRITLIALLLLILLAGCASPSPANPPIATPAGAVPITDADGSVISSQPGSGWVMVSGVDDHGLIVEHELNVTAAAGVDGSIIAQIHTGSAVVVQEIRQIGPQALRRYYHIEALDGTTGWISDYYIRRVVYLFNENGTSVILTTAPGNGAATSLPNVSPVTILDPTDENWWQVQAVEQDLTGWVASEFVKESPEPEFLLNQQHDHEE
ncbi:MAG: hypothetical protein KDE59_04000 [Anaerolineales bacterium]|nr:hypothetical protein [Anaerolineales bacterium]